VSELEIRPYARQDEAAVVSIWKRSGLLQPTADAARDIRDKLEVQPEMFLVGVRSGRVVGTVMAGYDGHRGWIHYLGVDPDVQGEQVGAKLVEAAEERLVEAGCRKVNLQVRAGNEKVVGFYRRLGFSVEDRVSMGKRLR
jgi:ribosomal protein S18 acetylase RimI-like enzyme